MIKIDHSLLDLLSQKAKTSKRLRVNHNFHQEESDVLQRMLNVMEPDTYICPHRHINPDKREAFWCLRGEIAVIEFNDQGAIVDQTILNPSKGIYGCEIELRQWHSIIALAPNSVAYEVKDGPYNPETDKHFASWAPQEGDPKAKEYLKQLKELLFKQYPEQA